VRQRASSWASSWAGSRAGSRAALAVLLLVVAGCGGPDVEPGPDGASAACTSLLDRLPGTVLDRRRSELDVAGAAAWGDPPVVLRCGVPPTGPTSNPCIEADDVDWTFAQSGDTLRFTTFGRNPAVEVNVPGSVGRDNASGALIDLAAAVRAIPATSACIGPEDA
jgi:hypothetical protein